MPPDLKRALLRRAAEPYRTTGIFPYRWARGKLNHDPLFETLLDVGAFPNDARVLDLGCGLGLLAAWFLAAEEMASQGAWNGRTAPPTGLQFRGIDLAGHDTDTGNRALKPLFGERLDLENGDLRNADLAQCDVIVILDVLHYIPHEDQDRLLDRIVEEMPARGLLAIRVGDAKAGIRFQVGRITDRVVSTFRGHPGARMWFRSMHEWLQALESRAFHVQARPMSQGTPFANTLLLARKLPSPPLRAEG